MSATLDGARVAACSTTRPSSRARAAPFRSRRATSAATRTGGSRRRWPAAVLRRARGRAGLDAGLPARPGRDHRARPRCSRAAARPGEVEVAPLYGALDRAAQDRAVRPAPAGRRKIVLATSIAETSLTIEGVRVVVDSGLARVPRYEPDLGLTRLETVRVSRASADQRRGRAGRTEPGRLLPAVGGGRDRRAAGLRPARNPRRRPVRPGARSRRLGRRATRQPCAGSIRRRPRP